MFHSSRNNSTFMPETESILHVFLKIWYYVCIFNLDTLYLFDFFFIFLFPFF